MDAGFESRPPFDVLVQNAAVQFAREMLETIPELEGVAVVPSYRVFQPSIPFAFIVGRLGPLRTPNEIMHMATQLHAALNVVMTNALETIHAYDRQMGELAAEFRKLSAAQENIPDVATTPPPG